MPPPRFLTKRWTLITHCMNMISLHVIHPIGVFNFSPFLIFQFTDCFVTTRELDLPVNLSSCILPMVILWLSSKNKSLGTNLILQVLSSLWFRLIYEGKREWYYVRQMPEHWKIPPIKIRFSLVKMFWVLSINWRLCLKIESLFKFSCQCTTVLPLYLYTFQTNR